MSDLKEYRGTIKEISQTSDNDRAPRKVLVNDGGDFDKTFRVWPFMGKDSQDLSAEMQSLQDSLNEEVTIFYEEEAKQGSKGSWTQNTIRSVGGPPKGKLPPLKNNGSYGGNAMTEDKVLQIVKDHLREIGIYSLVGEPSTPPDYKAFLDKASEAGFNENGVEKRWATFEGDWENTPWCQATQDRLEAFAKELGFTFGKAPAGTPEGAF